MTGKELKEHLIGYLHEHNLIVVKIGNRYYPIQKAYTKYVAADMMLILDTGIIEQFNDPHQS